jgi:mRNA interferase MazF
MAGETDERTSGAAGIRMGDIFIVNWDPGRGSEQAGERPALVVQNNAFNSNDRYPNTIVVTISKSGRDLPTHVKLPQTADNGLWEPLSYVKCEQLLTISKSRLGRNVGKITPEQLADVSRALKRLLSLA